MHFEELKIMTNDRKFVIDVIEKRLIERNVSYVKLNYEGYTELHFLDYIYRILFLELENEKSGKYEVLNKMMNSVDKGILDISPDGIFFDISENNTKLEMKNYSENLEDKKTGYKKYRKSEDRKFYNQKVNVKSKFKNNLYRRG